MLQDNKEIMKKLEAEEQTLIFDEFDSEVALEVGNRLIAEAKKRNNKITLDIFAFGRTLFHYSSNKNAPSNDIMAERKKNTALFTGHSSLWAHYFLKEIKMTIAEKWSLDPSMYAQVGGAFPVRVKTCGGVVGTITVSGFPHTEDHSIVTDVIKEYLNIQ